MATDAKTASEIAGGITEALIDSKALPFSVENAEQLAQQMAEFFKTIYVAVKDAP